MANHSKESCAAVARDMQFIIRDNTAEEKAMIKEFKDNKNVKQKK